MLQKLYLLLLLAKLIASMPASEDDASLRTSVDLSYLGEKAFGTPSNESGKKVSAWTENSEENPEEMGEYAEGDILFPTMSRNGMVAETFRWKNGVIPYEIAGIFPPSELLLIQKAMDIYHKYTCVSFRPRLPTDSDYISIVNGPTGCWSSVGRIGGRQEINLQSPYCITKVGTPMHELMHAVGFLHEQNRYERDDFVTIAWQNIKKGHDNNFDKADKDKTNGFGVPYDYRSVMHYSKNAFSINGQPTIIAKDSSKVDKMGQRDGFTKGDITKINAMYGCPSKSPTGGAANSNDNNKENVKPGGLLSMIFG